jgi:hypothetical protein
MDSPEAAFAAPEKSDALASDQEQVNDEDGDQEEGAAEVCGLQSEVAFVAGQVGRWDVAGFVIVFMHGYKLVRCGGMRGKLNPAG